jgi:hypothetical protein
MASKLGRSRSPKYRLYATKAQQMTKSVARKPQFEASFNEPTGDCEFA